MKPTKLIAYFLLLSVSFASAQMMNVRKWRLSERDSLDAALEFYDENQVLMALPIFEALLQAHPQEDFLKFSFGKCALSKSAKHEEAYEYLSEMYAKTKKLPDLQLDMARAAHFTYRFEEARKALAVYTGNKRINLEGRSSADLLARSLTFAENHYKSPTGARVTNAGGLVNTDADETVPAITADGSAMIFTYSGPKSLGGRQNSFLQPEQFGVFMPDVYYSELKGGQFNQAMPLDSFNTNAAESVVSLSADGHFLFSYQDIGDGHGDLYISRRNGQFYSAPSKLKGSINGYSYDGHCSLSPDGKMLFFSSSRPDGKGGIDIYRASLQADSTWGNVVNLGDSVNTPFDEESPFVHADGKTLFYSSKGRNSMGGYDVFRSVMGNDTTFTFSENLGHPINTPADDLYFTMTADGKKAFMSGGRKDGQGGDDIYEIEPAFNYTPALLLVKGRTLSNDAPIGTTVSARSEGGAEYMNTISGAYDGKYLVCLPAGSTHTLLFTTQAGATQSLVVQGNSESYEEKNQDIEFEKKAVMPVAAAPDTSAVSTPTQALAAAETKTASETPETGIKPEGAVSETVATSPSVAATTDRKQGWPMPGPVHVIVKKDKNFPRTGLQEKTMRFVERYGTITAEGLEFYIQVAAVRNDNKTSLPNQQKLGKLGKLNFNDGFTRYTVGGAFATLEKAFEHNRRVVMAGQPEGYVIAMYKGRRVAYEELEELGIFR